MYLIKSGHWHVAVKILVEGDALTVSGRAGQVIHDGRDYCLLCCYGASYPLVDQAAVDGGYLIRDIDGRWHVATRKLKAGDKLALCPDKDLQSQLGICATSVIGTVAEDKTRGEYSLITPSGDSIPLTQDLAARCPVQADAAGA